MKRFAEDLLIWYSAGTMAYTNILTQAEVNGFLGGNLDWNQQEKALVGSFTLPDFSTALAVINEVGKLAEEMQHHPTIINTYNTLTFELITHDADDQITDLDTRMANQISRIVAEKGS